MEEKVLFGHEKLKVYQKSLEFIDWSSENIINKINRKFPVIDQLERASMSISLNIAEGNGKYTAKDKCRYLDIARGSAFECAACLDVIKVRKLMVGDDIYKGKLIINEIVKLLVGLIKSSSDRTFEPSEKYDNDNN